MIEKRAGQKYKNKTTKREATDRKTKIDRERETQK